ncbi:MAG: DnaJ domain-containing protein [Candidatus Magasanikbacteria bacterium]|nr:DnaJ domain-containing protein [Candidatus Magasanikbacteria bacterium]
MSKDYYKILGVEKNATTDEIKKAFKKAAMQHHPDRPGGDEKKFKEANEAYQVLSDADKRAKYDQFGSDFEQQGGFGGGAGWEDFMHSARGGQGGFQFEGDLGDIFGEMFGFGGGRSQRASRQSRGHDIQVDVELEFKEAAFGVEKHIHLRKQSTCDVCGGNGAEPGSKLDTCSTCKGQGQVVQIQRTFLGAMQTVVTCTDCKGRGQKPSKKCKHCDGSGVVQKDQDITVKIPGGIDEGESIRLTGYGEAAPHGGQAGDLYVRAHIKCARRNRIWTNDKIKRPWYYSSRSH